MKICHEQVKSFSCKSKLSSPALRNPSVVHSDLRFPFLAYFYQKQYTFRPKFIFKKNIDQLFSADVNVKKNIRKQYFDCENMKKTPQK